MSLLGFISISIESVLMLDTKCRKSSPTLLRKKIIGEVFLKRFVIIVSAHIAISSINIVKKTISLSMKTVRITVSQMAISVDITTEYSLLWIGQCSVFLCGSVLRSGGE